MEVRLYFPGGVLPYKGLVGMCRWMGSHGRNVDRWPLWRVAVS